MAILKKRRSTASLPQATSEKGVLVSGAPGSKLTSQVNKPNAPVSAPVAPLIPRNTKTSRPSTTLTSAVVPAGAAPAQKKPAISAPNTTKLTTKVSGVGRPTTTKTGSSGKSSGSALTSALAGAALGVAGKKVWDKVSPKPAAGAKPVPKPVPKPASAPVPKPASKPAPKPSTTPALKPPAGGKPPAGTKPTIASATVIPNAAKPGETGYGWKYLSDGRAIDPIGNVFKDGEIISSPSGLATQIENAAQVGDDAFGWQYFSDGTAVSPDGVYYQNGEEVWSPTEGFEVNELANEAKEGEIGYGWQYYSDGTAFDPDGRYYVDGELAYTPPVTEAQDYDPDASTNGLTDAQPGSGLFTDGEGNYYDEGGNLVHAPDETGWFEGADEGQYYIDDSGNYFNGDGDLVWSPNGDVSSQTAESLVDDYGNTYNSYGELVNESEAAIDAGSYTDNGVATESGDYDPNWYGHGLPETPVEWNSEPYYDDYNYWDYKRGGSVNAKDGGVQHYEEGGEVEWFEDGSRNEYNADGTYTTYGSDGEVYIAATGSGSNLTELENSAQEGQPGVGWQYYSDGTAFAPDGSYWKDGEMILPAPGAYTEQASVSAPAPTGATEIENAAETGQTGAGWQYFTDGTAISPDGAYYQDGDLIWSPTGGTATTAIENAAQEGQPGYGWQYFTDGTSISPSGVYYNNGKPVWSPTSNTAPRINATQNLANWFTENPTLGAGATGALLGALMSDSSLFSGSGQQNTGVDMSKVGALEPRTTDFGIGPAKFATYDEYSSRGDAPDIYGDELYRNLNAPGFNPVNEGDYGYEDPAATTQTPVPTMAEGGSTGTYFTFGQAVDPLQNLRNPVPHTPQQGGLGAQKPQAPQISQPMQGMKGGGLPAISMVPMAGGRLDFRQGASVHGPGDGQSDDIPAMLADGEYVIDAETVAQIGNGSTKAGAKALDEFRMNIRKQKRSAKLDKIPPKTKALTSYLKKGN